MNDIAHRVADERDSSAKSIESSNLQPMTVWGRLGMIAALTVGAVVTLRAVNHLLGAILNVPAIVGIPAITVISLLVWVLPLFFVPSLRDVGSLRLPRHWVVVILLPIIVHNWSISKYFVAASVPWQAVLFYSVSAVGAGLFEELVWRGYAFRRVPLAHPRLVVLATAFFFALAHTPYILERTGSFTILQTIFSLVTGVALGIVRLVSGSLAWCILLHAAINLAEPLGSPEITSWRPYLWALLAIASAAILFWHPVFRRRGSFRPLSPAT